MSLPDFIELTNTLTHRGELRTEHGYKQYVDIQKRSMRGRFDSTHPCVIGHSMLTCTGINLTAPARLMVGFHKQCMLSLCTHDSAFSFQTQKAANLCITTSSLDCYCKLVKAFLPFVDKEVSVRDCLLLFLQNSVSATPACVKNKDLEIVDLSRMDPVFAMCVECDYINKATIRALNFKKCKEKGFEDLTTDGSCITTLDILSRCMDAFIGHYVRLGVFPYCGIKMVLIESNNVLSKLTYTISLQSMQCSLLPKKLLDVDIKTTVDKIPAGVDVDTYLRGVRQIKHAQTIVPMKIGTVIVKPSPSIFTKSVDVRFTLNTTRRDIWSTSVADLSAFTDCVLFIEEVCVSKISQKCTSCYVSLDTKPPGSEICTGCNVYTSPKDVRDVVCSIEDETRIFPLRRNGKVTSIPKVLLSVACDHRAYFGDMTTFQCFVACMSKTCIQLNETSDDKLGIPLMALPRSLCRVLSSKTDFLLRCLIAGGYGDNFDARQWSLDVYNPTVDSKKTKKTRSVASALSECLYPASNYTVSPLYENDVAYPLYVICAVVYVSVYTLLAENILLTDNVKGLMYNLNGVGDNMAVATIVFHIIETTDITAAANDSKRALPVDSKFIREQSLPIGDNMSRFVASCINTLSFN